MELSKRLQAVADLVTKGLTVADIGCDHGYVSIYLIEQKISPKVIAMDVNKGPLERAREHIAQYGLSDYIDTRLSDGAKALADEEAEALICAGMGGRLTIHILESELTKIRKMKECILQPQSEIGFVRKRLRKLEFSIVEENMVEEDGKYYPMMKVVPMSVQKTENLEVEDKFGKILLQNKNAVLLEYLKKEQEKFRIIKKQLVSLSEENEARTKRVEEVEKELNLIEQAFSYYQ